MDYIGFLMNSCNGALPCYLVKSLQGSLRLLTFLFLVLSADKCSTYWSLMANQLSQMKSENTKSSSDHWHDILALTEVESRVAGWLTATTPYKQFCGETAFNLQSTVQLIFFLQCSCSICFLINSCKIRQPTSVNRLSHLRSDQLSFLLACIEDTCIRPVRSC